MNDRMRRYMMTRNSMDMDPENKFRDSRGREHYDNGRYATDRRNIRLLTPENQMIGFDTRDEYNGNYRNEYNDYYGYGGRMAGGESTGSYESMQPGYEDGEEYTLTREMANRWVSGLKNADGTSGGHWPYEQTKQVLAQKAYNVDPLEFYVAVNMMYSDYVKAAKEFNVNNVDFYACMAKAFLEDKDADGDKLISYYYAIVEK